MPILGADFLLDHGMIVDMIEQSEIGLDWWLLAIEDCSR